MTTGYRAAGEIAGLPRSARLRSQRERMSAVPEDDVLLGLIRGSLDHCVKCTICETHCPVAAATPLFPGPKYVGPQAERFRARRGGLAGRLGRLLLELRHLHAGLPAGRANRGDQQPRRAARLEGGHGRPAARPAPRAGPTLLGRLGTPVAPLANWTLANKPLRVLTREDPRRSTGTPPCPKFAGPTFSAGRQGPRRSPPEAPKDGRLLPRLRRELLRARPRREDRGGARAQRLRGDRPQAGLLRAAAPVQRPLRRRPRLLAAPGDAPRAARARRARHRGDATSCGLMVKREAREILGLEDDPTSASSASTCSTSASSCSTSTTAASCARTSSRVEEVAVPRPLPAAGSRHRHAGARPLRPRPGPRDGRDATRTAAASPARTG